MIWTRPSRAWTGHPRSTQSSVGGGLAGEGDSLRAGQYLNEQTLALGEDLAGFVQYCGLCPMLPSLVMVKSALESDGSGARNGPEVVDLHVARHADHVVGADGFTHGLVEQGGDNSAVEIAARAFKRIGNGRQADHGAVFGKHEFEMQSRRI